MIFWQIIIFFLGIIIIAGSISGYGILINFNKKKNFFLNIFLGLTVISFIITFTHFFFKITFLLSSIIFTIGFVFFLYNKNFSFLSLFQKKNFYYIIIIFLLIPIFLSQKYHEDFGYYHLPYAIGLIEEKIVFGFANIDYPYVYNSIWLNLYSIFFLIDKNFDFLTLPTYLCYLSFILFSINQVISKKSLSKRLFLVITLFYFILKFTNFRIRFDLCNHFL